MLGRVYYELTDTFDVPADVDRCWRFFGTAENLPLITPPWLKFTIAMPTPPPAIAEDTVLDYTIRWRRSSTGPRRGSSSTCRFVGRTRCGITGTASSRWTAAGCAASIA
jgi:hypothetical protein